MVLWLFSLFFFLAKKTNGMANGPKTAPMTAQNLVFAPLLSAINQRKYAHAIHIIEMIIKPAIVFILLYFHPQYLNTQQF